jgi:hypothetical protein
MPAFSVVNIVVADGGIGGDIVGNTLISGSTGTENGNFFARKGFWMPVASVSSVVNAVIGIIPISNTSARIKDNALFIIILLSKTKMM